MSTRIGKLQTFLKEPFGVGVFEQIEDRKTFGFEASQLNQRTLRFMSMF